MRMCLALLIGLTWLTGGTARAAFILVTSRTALGGTDSLNWATIGPNGTIVPNMTAVTSADGSTASVRLGGSGQMVRRTQGAGAGQFRGNFAPGDALLASTTATPLFVDFGGPVTAAGAQIQVTNATGPFTARIFAVAENGTLIRGFDVPALSTNGNDNTAVFVGIIATDGDTFHQLRFNAYTGPINAATFRPYAINQLDFTPVPAPPAAVLAVIGAAVLGLARARRRLTGS